MQKTWNILIGILLAIALAAGTGIAYIVLVRPDLKENLPSIQPRQDRQATEQNENGQETIIIEFADNPDEVTPMVRAQVAHSKLLREILPQNISIHSVSINRTNEVTTVLWGESEMTAGNTLQLLNEKLGDLVQDRVRITGNSRHTGSSEHGVPTRFEMVFNYKLRELPE